MVVITPLQLPLLSRRMTQRKSPSCHNPPTLPSNLLEQTPGPNGPAEYPTTAPLAHEGPGPTLGVLSWLPPSSKTSCDCWSAPRAPCQEWQGTPHTPGLYHHQGTSRKTGGDQRLYWESTEYQEIPKRVCLLPGLTGPQTTQHPSYNGTFDPLSQVLWGAGRAAWQRLSDWLLRN